MYTGEYVSNYELLKVTNLSKTVVETRLNTYFKPKTKNASEIGKADTETFNELVYGLKKFISNIDLYVIAYFQGEVGGTPPHTYIFNYYIQIIIKR